MATYTVLISVDNDEAPRAEGLANQIQAALEVGMPGWASFTHAVVDAFRGDLLAQRSPTAAKLLADHRHVAGELYERVSSKRPVRYLTEPRNPEQAR
jgi:hypothetical protein